MKNLAIFGAGGHANVMIEIAELSGWSDICVFDDAISSAGAGGYPLVGDIKRLLSQAKDFDCVHIAVGNNQTREVLAKKLHKLRLVSLVHPTAIISPKAIIEEGVAICAGVIVNAYAQIGMCSILNSGVIVDHHSIIGNYAHVAPGCSIAGEITVGARSLIGTGTSIIPSLAVGQDVIIGAGSVVTSNIPDNSMGCGAPCKIIKKV